MGKSQQSESWGSRNAYSLHLLWDAPEVHQLQFSSSYSNIMGKNDGFICKELTISITLTNIQMWLWLQKFHLLEEIHATHKQYKIAASFKRVKEHQDSSKSLQSLPLPVQLKVEADLLASSFYHEGPLSIMNINMTQQGISITTNYTKHLLQAYVGYQTHLHPVSPRSIPLEYIYVTLAISWTELQ